jgi:hypothetical protein
LVLEPYSLVLVPWFLLFVFSFGAEVQVAADVPSLAGSASLGPRFLGGAGSFVATLQARQPVGGNF